MIPRRSARQGGATGTAGDPIGREMSGVVRYQNSVKCAPEAFMDSRFPGRAVAALAVAVSVSACNQTSSAQGGGAMLALKEGPAVPYKLGTFERSGQPFMGLVLRDTQVVDIAQANAAVENGDSSAPKLAVPADLKELITKYDAGWKDRLAAIARSVPAEGIAFAYAVDTLKALPPVRPSL